MLLAGFTSGLVGSIGPGNVPVAGKRPGRNGVPFGPVVGKKACPVARNVKKSCLIARNSIISRLGSSDGFWDRIERLVFGRSARKALRLMLQGWRGKDAIPSKKEKI